VSGIGWTPSGDEIAAWILKGDPKVFDLDAELEERGLVESWSVHETYRTGLMAEGQRCYMWRSGPEAAIIASGYVTGQVESGQANVEDWVDQEKAKSVNLFVPVELYQLGEVITRSQLKARPVLSQIELLRMPMGSNPSILIPEEFEALEVLVAAIEERDTPVAIITTKDARLEVYPSEMGDGSSLYGQFANEELAPAQFDDELEAILAGLAAVEEQVRELPAAWDPFELDVDELPVLQIKTNLNDFLRVYKVIGGFQALRFSTNGIAAVGVLYPELTTLIRAIYDDDLYGSDIQSP
jgi:hypothetical protein